jgi:hypothetical protein
MAKENKVSRNHPVQRNIMKYNVVSILFFLFTSSLLNAQLTVSGNNPYKKTSGTPIESGPAVVGAFEGRTPCSQVLEVLNLPTRPDCFKLKWSLTLFQEPETKQPTTFALKGSYSNHVGKNGKWIISRGMPGNPEAVIYELSLSDPQATLYIFQGDENVLFLLDKNKQFLKGNKEFSYTLNRVVN